MAIEVKHGSDPAALAAVSFGGSQGATRSRLRAGMLAATEQRVNAERNRESISERDAERAKVDQQNAERNRESISERDAERAKVDQQNMLAGQAGQREMIDYRNNADIATAQTKFTDKQRQEFAQMNQAYDDARKSGDFSETELKEIKRQITAKQAMIEPLPALPEEAPDTWKQAQSKMFTDPETGRRGYINKDGEPEFFNSEVDKQKESIDKQKESITRRYRELADKQVIEQKEVTVGGKNILQATPRDRTPEEIKKAIDDEQAFMESYLNPDAAAPAGKVVDENGDTTYEGEAGLAIQKTERLFNSLRGMDGRKLSPEAKAVLRLGEDSFYAAAQEKANAHGISVNEYISIVMKGLTQ